MMVRANPDLAEKLLNIQTHLAKWMCDLGLHSVGQSNFEKELKLTPSEVSDLYSIQMALMLHLDLARMALDPEYITKLQEMASNLKDNTI